MVGSAAVIRRDGHISVTILVDHLSAPLAHAIGLLRDGLVLIMAGAIAYYGFALIGGRRASPALEISMYYPFLAIPVGAVLIAVLLLLKRAGEATLLIRRQADDPPAWRCHRALDPDRCAARFFDHHCRARRDLDRWRYQPGHHRPASLCWAGQLHPPGGLADVVRRHDPPADRFCQCVGRSLCRKACHEQRGRLDFFPAFRALRWPTPACSDGFSFRRWCGLVKVALSVSR